jgi:1,4-alpha-glucan branching enzyme
VLNSDAIDYGGSGVGNAGSGAALSLPQHGRPCRLVITVPPLGLVVFRGHGEAAS